jgi:oligopeptide transport system substrate-binding protein
MRTSKPAGQAARDAPGGAIDLAATFRRRTMRLCLGVALAAALPSWAAAVPPGTPLAAKQEMVRNNGAEPESLDPQLIESTNAFNILIDLFEGLTALDNHAHVVPGVAQSWQQTDPTTWVFKLRGNALWSNGESVIAQDFVYGWHRLVDPKSAAPLGSTYGAYILNGVAITQGKLPVAALGVRAIDATTLEVKTPGPLPFLPYLLVNPQFAPAPHATLERLGREWTKPGNLVGNGAYVLKDWQVNNKVVVEKNARYWDAANVQLTRVTYLPVEDSNADLKLYQSGENDFVQRLAPGTYASLKAQYPKEMHNSAMIALRFYALNNTDPLLKDLRVRKALSMVIDREILASKVTADGQAPLYGLPVKGSEGVDPVRYDWADWPMDRRVAEARRLLAEAGVKPGTRLKFAYNTSDYHKKMAIFAASEWKTKLGLDTELESMEFKVLIRRRQTADYQIARHAWIPGFADITGFLELVECGNDANDNKSCNKAADELIRQAGALADPARRKALMTQAVRLEMDDYPLIPLLQMSTPRLVKPWIGGYDDANDQDSFRSKDFYVIRH